MKTALKDTELILPSTKLRSIHAERSMEFRNVGPLNLGMGRKNSDDRDLKIHRFGVGERVFPTSVAIAYFLPQRDG